MGTYSTKEEVYQSYFRNMCKVFSIAYEEVKRLEKEQQKNSENSPKDELKMIKEILKLDLSEEIRNKYLNKKYTEKQLKKEKDRLQRSKDEYDKKNNEINEVLKYWSDVLWDRAADIVKLIKKMEDENVLITVTRREEIIALMAYFREYSVEEYRIINLDEEILKQFPTDEKMCQEFYEAYSIANADQMKQVVQKYF